MGSACRPHLLLVTGSLECGGSERQLADMANFWASNGRSVTLATWSGAGVADFYRLDARVVRVHLNVDAAGTIRASLMRVAKLRKLLSRARPDAVLSFLTRSNVPTLLAGLGLPVRLVVSERVQPAHETGLELPWRLLRRFVYARADVIVCQTRATAEWIRSAWGRVAVVVPNALRPLPPDVSSRGSLIVGIGRLVRQKGFDVLLRAFARVARDFPDWRVAVVGEGPERGALLSLRDELGLAEQVEFAGHRRDVEAWLARAGLVVQPSRFEGFPNAVLEGMGMGAAVITTDCPAGPAELIEDGVNGRLVPVDDVEALARAIAELISRPDERRRLGRAALDVRDRFRQESVMALWEAVLLPG